MGGAAIHGFDPDVSTYVADWPRNRPIPAVTAVPAQSGAGVEATDGGTVLTSAASRLITRTVKVTSPNAKVTRTYTVAFQRTDHDHRPAATGGGPAGTPGGHGGGSGPADAPGLWSRGTEWARTRGVPRA
ncbi:hypothetical protein [Streptomyces sennicomposti]